MKTLVRYITKKRDGAISSRDERVDSETLSFGRGASNNVVLQSIGVLLKEGSIHYRNEKLFFELEF